MTRRRSSFLLVSLAVLLPLVASVLWSANSSGDSAAGEGDSLFQFLGLFTEVLGLARREYVDPVDTDRLLTGALEGAVEALGPGAVWVPQEAVEVYRKAVELHRGETGLEIRRERGIPYVTSVLEGSPAARAGVEPGWILAEIHGRTTRELPAWELITLLRGESGQRKQLVFLENGKEREVELILEPLSLPPPRLELLGTLPVLRIPALSQESLAPLRELLGQLRERGATKLLVDLMGCAWGEPKVGFEAAGLWVEGELGRADRRGQVVQRYTSDEPPVWRGEAPVVLVDSGTRGACEVLAGVLRSAASAKLVGLKTFGWAGERDLVRLPSGGWLEVTRVFFAPREGKPISEGLEPDVAVDDLAFGFGDRERTLPELIRDVGGRLLRGEPIPENLRS
jgi:carboxyl-terminal processing protease